MKTLWIDGQGTEEIGEYGFLVRVSNEINQGPDRTTLQDAPAYTNMSCEPRLRGWCGTTNNQRVEALGLGKVIKVARNGRVKVEVIEDPETLATQLEELGHPELFAEQEATEGD